jgi:hypothetical protein
MDMKGKILDALPPVTPRRAKNDWDTPALMARANPGKAVLAGERVRVGQISSIRGYTRPPFHDDAGDIQISMRNSYIEDNIRYGDVFFVFVPAKKDSDESTKGTP